MIPELKDSLLGKVLTAEQLNSVADRSKTQSLPAGASFCEPEDVLDCLYVVLKGCLRASTGSKQSQRTSGFINSGEAVGAYCLLTGQPMLATLEAEFDTRLLAIPKAVFDEIVEQSPDLIITIRRSFHERIASVLQGKKLRRFARNVVFVLPDSSKCKIPIDVAAKLAKRGERVAIVTEQNVDSEQLTRFPLDEKQQFFSKWQDTEVYDFDRFIFCLPHSFARELVELMDRANEILWCFHEHEGDATRAAISRIQEKSPENVSKIKRICLLSNQGTVAPAGISDSRLHRRDFITPEDDTPQSARMYRQGVDRITRHLCDIKIGLSLAGGGARGLVHFGILQALDRAGISFDMLSGTSAGAMFGLSYATGETPEYLLQEYNNNLKPGFPFTIFRNSDRWYLLWKFRTRGWDRMLRSYFDYSFDQLPIPFYSVAVDLVSGKQVVRDSGDIIQAMLESLNLPGIAKPILRDGMALVDGGVLNNLPTNVLLEHGADFILGANVSSGLNEEFGKNRPHMKTQEMRSVGNIETLFRVLEVMGTGTAHAQRSAANILLTPDTSAFSFTDFTQGEGLAEIGEQCVDEALPQIRSQIDALMRF